MLSNNNTIASLVTTRSDEEKLRRQLKKKKIKNNKTWWLCVMDNSFVSLSTFPSHSPFRRCDVRGEMISLTVCKHFLSFFFHWLPLLLPSLWYFQADLSLSAHESFSSVCPNVCSRVQAALTQSNGLESFSNSSGEYRVKEKQRYFSFWVFFILLKTPQRRNKSPHWATSHVSKQGPP